MKSRPAVLGVHVLVVAALAIVVSPSDALATREYAKAEGKECAYCHLNPKGGGPRNDRGREYEANGHEFGVKSWTSDVTERKYLRASSAIVAQWYAEAGRLLDELAKEETAAGGLALVGAARDRFKMFPRAWLGAAKKLLAGGPAGVPNAAAFLAKTESQFGRASEGKEATKRLDELAKDDATKADAERARAVEKARVRVLEGTTEFLLGNAARARELLEKALADPDAKGFEKEVRETLARIPAAK
jgi:tetratricopeptide (TPR) repeat protein